jgi:hypothetical protein
MNLRTFTSKEDKISISAFATKSVSGFQIALKKQKENLKVK